MEEIRGRDVVVGDDLEFLGTVHRVLAMEPYENDFAVSTFGEPARIAMWAGGQGMTIDPNGTYRVYR